MHGLDSDLRRLLDRQDLQDDEKLKLYQQALSRYMTLNRKRMAPVTMNLVARDDDSNGPPTLKKEDTEAGLGPPTLVKESQEPQKPLQLKLNINEEREHYGLPALFAEATHLPDEYLPRKKKKKKKKTKGEPKAQTSVKWTPY